LVTRGGDRRKLLGRPGEAFLLDHGDEGIGFAQAGWGIGAASLLGKPEPFLGTKVVSMPCGCQCRSSIM